MAATGIASTSKTSRPPGRGRHERATGVVRSVVGWPGIDVPCAASCDAPRSASRGVAVLTQQRSTSATLHACATQPRGVYGGSASKISLIDADAGLVEMRRGSRPGTGARPAARSGCVLHPRVDERADQPGPDRALVVGAVARAQIAVVRRLVVGMSGIERAQADRREQPRVRRSRAPPPSASDRAPDGAARTRESDSAGRPDRRRARRRRRRRDGGRPRTRTGD